MKKTPKENRLLQLDPSWDEIGVDHHLEGRDVPLLAAVIATTEVKNIETILIVDGIEKKVEEGEVESNTDQSAGMIVKVKIVVHLASRMIGENLCQRKSLKFQLSNWSPKDSLCQPREACICRHLKCGQSSKI